jgi:hypothetical protein
MGSSCADQSGLKKIEFSAAIHLPLHHFPAAFANNCRAGIDRTLANLEYGEGPVLF